MDKSKALAAAGLGCWENCACRDALAEQLGEGRVAAIVALQASAAVKRLNEMDSVLSDADPTAERRSADGDDVGKLDDLLMTLILGSMGGRRRSGGL